MKTNSDHTSSQNSNWQKLEQLNSKVTVKWGESADEIWRKMENQLQQPVRQPKVIFMPRTVMQWAVAAVILVLFGLTALMRFYTETVMVPDGEHRLVELPDQSQVHLNAGSAISYHPFWWKFSREARLDGEAYFEVEKGSRFQVESTNGSTTVLGTSFNIYSRDEAYRVTCLSGKVQVSDPTDSKIVVLLPDEKAEWVKNDFVKTTVESQQDIAWTNNQFVFTRRPVREVFEEIERQYEITLDVAPDINYVYSGNFEKSNDVKQVLDYVCRPLNLKFTEEKTGVFRIEK